MGTSFFRFVTQSTRLTDGRTDRRTDSFLLVNMRFHHPCKKLQYALLAWGVSYLLT